MNNLQEQRHTDTSRATSDAPATVMTGEQRRSLPSYVLVTPARNEEAFIEKTICSMIRQTMPPLKWVIVEDGSTDKTADVIKKYLGQCPWMEMVQMPQRRDRSFAGKVQAFNAGYEQIKTLPYEVIGNLDADISFDEDHFEFLLGQFAADSTLGVAGTVFKEEGYSSETDSFEGHKHVSGQCQLFRRGCWEEIGGYIPHRAGGIDWMAVTTARMMGWKTRVVPGKSFFHHRHLGTAERGVFASSFSYGEKDYYLGGHPLWELFRVRLSGYQETLHHRWIRPWTGLLLGITKEDSASGIHRPHGISSQRADGQAQSHPENSFIL